MASLPPRQASQQRRSSPEQTSSNQPESQTPSSPVRQRSANLEDSQTIFLNKQDQTEQTSPQQQAQDDAAVLKCWICFADSTEDTPESSPWRDPCPCALVAHEECLLDWIADMEAPNQRRNQRSLGAPKIECPQCKSEIKLARPRNLVVEAVRGVERLGSQLITPGALTVLFATVYNSSMAWGVHSVYAVFGSEDGFRILRPLILNHIRPPIEFENGTAREIGQKMLAAALDHVVHWRLYVGLPLITPMLILSRTTLADSVLPVLPVLFFATQNYSPDETLDFGKWPPSASLAFAVLPYIRTAYNLYYKKAWAEKERQWLKEIQPRQVQGQNDGTDNANNPDQAQDQAQDDDNIFEVRIDGGIWEDWEDEEQDPMAPVAQAEQQQQRQNQIPNNAPAQALQPQQQGDAQADPPPNIVDDRPADQEEQQQPADPQQNQPNNQQQQANGERRLSFSPTFIAETVLGALVFPTIAGMSGELLKLALPRSWTKPLPASKGLLQNKWGRSLVGGCLFVVLKDAMMLYVRWKMVQMHRRRRVLDWEGKKVRKG